jgi:hypothetical protein
MEHNANAMSSGYLSKQFKTNKIMGIVGIVGILLMLGAITSIIIKEFKKK